MAEQFRQITHLFWQNSMKEVLCNKQEVVRGEDLVTSTKESPSINVEGLFIRVCLFLFSPKLIVDLTFLGTQNLVELQFREWHFQQKLLTLHLHLALTF